MDRRSFLGKAVAAGAITTIGAAGLGSCKKELDNEALGLPPLLDRAPDGKKLKAGLVGCGNRGTGAALDFVAPTPGAECCIRFLVSTSSPKKYPSISGTI